MIHHPTLLHPQSLNKKTKQNCPRTLVVVALFGYMLKFNKHCSTFVLFDKKFPILD
jgi:hypothetical protein